MKIKKYLQLALLSSLICSFILVTQAQDTDNQTTNINIIGQTVLFTPDSINFQTKFASQSATQYTYACYDPSLYPSQRLRVFDGRNNGGFSVSVRATPFNLSDSGEQISYRNLSIVSVAKAYNPNDAHPKIVDFYERNIPPDDDQGTVTAPLHCPWLFHGNLDDFKGTCDNYFEVPNNTFSGSSENESDPKTIIDGTATTGSGRLGYYWIVPCLRLRIPPGTDYGNFNSTLQFDLS